MANPGKEYNLPCKLFFEYAMGGESILAFIEKLRLGRREYQINAYPIIVDNEDSYEQFLFEQSCGGEGDY